jgi:hypothetical protein
VRIAFPVFVALVLAGPAVGQIENENAENVFIDSLESEVTETNKSWNRHVWKATVRNAREKKVKCGIGIAWLDKEGTILDVDGKVAELEGGASGEYAGYVLIHQPDAAKVDRYDARLTCE